MATLVKTKGSIQSGLHQLHAFLALALIAVITLPSQIAQAATAMDGGTAASNYAAGSNLKDVNSNVIDNTDSTFLMVKSFVTFVGLLFIVGGVVAIKKSQKQGSQETPTGAIVSIVAGGLLAVAPWLLFTAANTIQATS